MVTAVGEYPPRVIYRRSWDRTRASSSTGLKGLGHIVVAPIFSPSTLSVSSDLAVSRITGRFRLCRSRVMAVMPSIPGIIIQQDQVYLLPVQQPQGLPARQRPSAPDSPRRTEINIQRRYDILFIVTDQDVVHGVRLHFSDCDRRVYPGRTRSEGQAPPGPGPAGMRGADPVLNGLPLPC